MMTTLTRIELYVPLIIKVEYGPSIRRTTLVSESICYNELVQTIRTLLNLRADDDIALQYLNNEDELVKLEDFFDLAMAVGQGRVIKINVRLIVNRDEIQEELLEIRARRENPFVRLATGGSGLSSVRLEGTDATVEVGVVSPVDLSKRASTSVAIGGTQSSRISAQVDTSEASVSGSHQNIIRFRLSAAARPFIPRVERTSSAPPSLLPLHYHPTPATMAMSPRPPFMGMSPLVSGIGIGDVHRTDWQAQPNTNRLHRGSLSLAGSPSGGQYNQRGLSVSVQRPLIGQPQPLLFGQLQESIVRTQHYPGQMMRQPPPPPRAQISISQQRFVPQPMQAIGTPRVLSPSQPRQQAKPF